MKVVRLGAAWGEREMARPIRLGFPDASYHVTARGHERRAIFKDDADRTMLVVTLAAAGVGLGGG